MPLKYLRLSFRENFTENFTDNASCFIPLIHLVPRQARFPRAFLLPSFYCITLKNYTFQFLLPRLKDV